MKKTFFLFAAMLVSLTVRRGLQGGATSRGQTAQGQETAQSMGEEATLTRLPALH